MSCEMCGINYGYSLIFLATCAPSLFFCAMDYLANANAKDIGQICPKWGEVVQKTSHDKNRMTAPYYNIIQQYSWYTVLWIIVEVLGITNTAIKSHSCGNIEYQTEVNTMLLWVRYMVTLSQTGLTLTIHDTTIVDGCSPWSTPGCTVSHMYLWRA